MHKHKYATKKTRKIIRITKQIKMYVHISI